jgi:hypothetical protein
VLDYWLKLEGAMKSRVSFLLIAVTLSLPMLLAPVYAQFRASQPLQLGQTNVFECAIVRATDTDRHDPIYKITVTLNFTDDEKLDSLTVIHTATSGATYSRSDQYERASLWQTEGRHEYYWKGTWNKNSAVTMVGELTYTKEDKWFYSEQQFKYGQQEYYMMSGCHQIQAAD